jgi:transcription initiation factor TFIIIB Brf1 subunit/transcription initiation factor TFIIB
MIRKRDAENQDKCINENPDKCINEDCPFPFDDKLVDHQRGDSICSSCGCVQPDQIFAEEEDKRNFMDSGKDHRRTQLVDPLFGFYSTHISGKSKKSKIMQRVNEQLLSKEDRSEIKSLKSIHMNLDCIEKQMGELTNIQSKTYMTAKTIGKKLVNNLQKSKRTVRGLRTMECAIALLYFASQYNKEGVSLRTLKMFKHDGKFVNPKKIKNFIKLIKEFVQIHGESANPVNMIRNIISNLGHPIHLENLAIVIYEEWEKTISNILCSRQPSTISGAAIVLAVEKMKEEDKDYDLTELTFSTIALLSNVAEGTLKNFLKHVENATNNLT